MSIDLLSEFNKMINPLINDTNAYCEPKIQNDKFLIPMIAEITQGITEPIEDQTNCALSAGIKPEAILEMIYQLSPVIGISKVKIALKEVQKSFNKNKVCLKKVTEMDNNQIGAEIQERIYGTEIKKLLSDLPDQSGDFISEALTEHFFNDFYKRPSLTVEERERYELLSLITLNVEFQIKAHARGSLKAGNSESQLITSVIQLLPYVGFPFVINSVQVIHQEAKELKNL